MSTHVNIYVCNMNGDSNAVPINDNNITNYQRCGSVYTRPYIKWCKIDSINTRGTNDNEQSMKAIVSGNM